MSSIVYQENRGDIIILFIIDFLIFKGKKINSTLQEQLETMAKSIAFDSWALWQAVGDISSHRCSEAF